MNRLLRMIIPVSTLTLCFIFFIEQVYAKNMRFPCILTAFENALVNELTRFHQSSYLATQANIKKCVIFGPSTILIYYEDGHTGLFSTGETIHLDSRQEKMEPHDTKMSDTLHNVPDQNISKDEIGKLYNEFVNVWHSAGLPDELSQESLAHADVLAQKLLCTTLLDESFIVSVLGSRGNRYLAFIEGCKVLSREMTIVFYEAYLTSNTYHTRTENIPTDHNKQAITKKLINMFEARKSFQDALPSVYISNQIKKFDPDAYARLMKFKIIQESDE